MEIKKSFIKSMEYLGKYYINFKVDFSDQLVQRVWFDSLKHINPSDLEYTVKDYCSKNIYPPQSPTHLLEHYRELSENKIRNIVLDVNNLINQNLKLVEVEIPFFGKEKKYVPDYQKIISKSTGIIRDIVIDIQCGKLNLDKESIKLYLSDSNNQKFLLEG